MKIDISAAWRSFAHAMRRHAPELLVTGGVIGMTAGTVLACRATMKLPEVLDRHCEKVLCVKESEGPNEKRELAKVYARTAADCVMLYAPSVTVGAVSATGIFAGHHMLHKRHIAVAAAYAALDQGFKAYRGRVVERFGEQTDRELRHGLHQEKITVETVDEDGKTRKTKQTVEVADASSGMPSDFARYFVYGEAKGAEPNFDYNLMFLKAQQEVANVMFRSKKLMHLNDVYNMLGIDPSTPGQRVGWVLDEQHPHGDNYINFRIQEVYRKKPDYPDEYERVLLIDPNVDGLIEEHAVALGLMTR